MIDLFTKIQKPRQFEGHNSMFIDGSERCWIITSGQVDIFSTETEEGEVRGARTHLATLETGDIFFGMDFSEGEEPLKLLASGRKNGRISECLISELLSSLKEAGRGEEFSESVDRWLSHVGDGIAKSVASRPKGEAALFPDESSTVEAGQAFSAKKEICWIDAPTSELLFLGTTDILFKSDHQWFPLVPFVFIETYEERELYPLTTRSLFARDPDATVAGLRAFHEVFIETIELFSSLTSLDESNRLHTKEEYQQAARIRTNMALASVLNPDLEEFSAEATDTNSVFNAIKLVALHDGIDIKPVNDMPEGEGFKTANLIAKASGIRTRKVALRGNWWKEDIGPFYTFRAKDNVPVAVIPVSSRARVMIDGKTGEKEPVTKDNAADLHPFGITLYRSLAPGELKPFDLLKFAIHSLKNEVVWIIGLGVVLGLTGIVAPMFTAHLLDSVIPGADKRELAQMVIGLIAVSISTIAFSVARGVAVSRMETKIEYGLQSALWSRVIGLPMSFFKKYSAGDLASRAYGISTIRDLISGVGITAILGAFTGLFNLIVLFTMSLQFAFIGISLVAVAVIFTLGLGIYQRSFSRYVYELDGKISSLVYQMISGVSKIRVSGAEDHALMLWSAKFSEMRKYAFKMGSIGNVMKIYQASYPTVCSMLLYYTLVKLQSAPGGEAFTTGSFIAFNAAFGMLLGSMLGLSSASVQLFQIKQVMERLRPILDQPIEEKGTFPGTLSGDLRLSHVNFRYVEDGPLILKELSLHIKEGEFVALAGPSGSGKSTVLRLLLGFEKPESGKVYFDDQDLESLQLSDVREQIGSVLQTSQLVPTDVFRNIVGQSDATMDDAWAAAAGSGLEEDIKAMPMGMHTVVSEGSGGFSGGQKQRLMIARALVKKPRIIFLDEATSALDNKTQAVVTDNMNRMQATRVVVAHRMSTIRHADRIIVLVDGRLEEDGSFDELVAKGGVFAELAKGQMEVEAEEEEFTAEV